ncbi:hypothetical protein AMECASPLE_032375 [Ameca splendens]|uniref:Uncharacterized protein n=1 Tax=Ameca splendens TaxID=208324 RepID=A0ABV0Z632_9TELE
MLNQVYFIAIMEDVAHASSNLHATSTEHFPLQPDTHTHSLPVPTAQLCPLPPRTGTITCEWQSAEPAEATVYRLFKTEIYFKNLKKKLKYMYGKYTILLFCVVFYVKTEQNDKCNY